MAASIHPRGTGSSNPSPSSGGSDSVCAGGPLNGVYPAQPTLPKPPDFPVREGVRAGVNLGLAFPKLIRREPLKHVKVRPVQLRDNLSMTVCTASLFFWNYATAPESDIGPAVVAASDRKLTDSSLGIGYEGSRFKGALLPNKKLVLIAGEMVAHSAIIRSLQTELKDQTLTTTDTADMVGQLVARYRMREAARQYLSPLNLNADTFLGQQRTMEANCNYSPLFG